MSNQNSGVAGVDEIPNRNIRLYILIGAWGDQEDDGTDVLSISDKIDEPIQKMDSIVANRAAGYQRFGEGTEEDIQGRSYEISDSEGRYARFYVVERDVTLSVMTAGEIFRNEDNRYKLDDAATYIKWMYDENAEGGIPAWKYEYAIENDAILQKIADEIYGNEDGNVAYNDILCDAVHAVLQGIDLTDDVLLALWDKFGDVPVDDDGQTEHHFMDFPAGTDRLEVRHWFDGHTPRGIDEFLEQKNMLESIAKEEKKDV